MWIELYKTDKENEFWAIEEWPGKINYDYQDNIKHFHTNQYKI